MSETIDNLCTEIGHAKIQLDRLQTERDAISQKMDHIAKQIEDLRLRIALASEVESQNN